MMTNNSATSMEHLYDDVLVRIFMELNVADLALVSLVCKSWNRASHDPTLWHKLDLSRLSSSSFNTLMVRDAWRDIHSSTKMTQFLKRALSLSNGNINCLIFNYYVYLTDEQLISAAERTPNLRRLVLPNSSGLSKTAICIAMRSWGGLESLTITSMVNYRYLFSAIGKYCRNIFQLKFTCSFEMHHAEALVKYTPNLKALSIRCIIVNIRALRHVLNLEHLEVVNISHSQIFYRQDGGAVVPYIYDLQNYLNISCIRKLILCERESCFRCSNDHDDDLRKQPYEPLEDLWREDEISSLEH